MDNSFNQPERRHLSDGRGGELGNFEIKNQGGSELMAGELIRHAGESCSD